VSPKATDDDTSLKRLAGVGWQTRDGRFTIETASGTWSLLDSEQTDDLGLPLVRGPFRSLTEAKVAIEAARTSGPPTPMLAERGSPATKDTAAAPGKAEPAADVAKPAKPTKPTKPAKSKEPEEPRWMADLGAGGRRRAHRLMARLEAMGVRDPEGVVRRDLAGDVPTVARAAVAERLAEILGEADAATVRLAGRLVEAAAEGREEALDVRWRLVDDDGRPIGVSADDIAAALKRRRGRP
jgi:hypothetical protein